jgi:hypothetical protein
MFYTTSLFASYREDGGQWVGGETGYSDNVVVFASLVKARAGG